MNKKQSQIKDVIIIGAGASGMMAAITAAKRGKSVLIIEQMDKTGKKLLATGNGKCNFTNEYMSEDCYHGNRKLLRSVSQQFGKEQTLDFFRELGIWPKEKNGYYYPNSETASAVVEALLMELVRLKVSIVTGCRVLDVSLDHYGFTVVTANGNYKGRKVIVSCGLLAAPKLGSDGSMFPILKELGHRFVSIVPALCGFYASGMEFKKVGGVRCEAKLSLYIDQNPCDEESGELQLTDYGISGIPVFQLSSAASLALAKRRSVTMLIDFLPRIEEEVLTKELCRRASRMSIDSTTEQLLCGLLNQKLIPVLLRKAGIQLHMPLTDLDKKNITSVTHVIKKYPVTLERVRDYEYAQVCAGGIRTEEINETTLESKLIPGLYFAGEILDVDGICGGYNLQWAWSSGYVAGSNI